MRFPLSTFAALIFAFGVCLFAVQANAADQPHVVLIMADDLGYGDVQPLNPASRVATPTFNRLAREGLTFVDAHTPSAVCTPTRYGLLTGQYCWRTRLKRGVQNGYGAPLIDTDRSTIGTVLGRAGYRTAVVGKWHLGLGLAGSEKGGIDFSQPLSHHPGSVGFDQSFIIPASLDFPPYFYFQDGMATTQEMVDQAGVKFPAYTRRGPRAADFNMRGCLSRLTDEAITVVQSMKDAEQPTFLYFPLTAPHKPVLPSLLFEGSTELGPYGDFLRQVDAAIGRVIQALESEEILEKTLLIVTSDNGSFMYQIDEDATDHTEDDTVQGYRAENHTSNGRWRGTKADIWEGGHRVPFFVRLPAKKLAGKRVNRVVGLVDVMATLTDYLDLEQVSSDGPDSVSFASVFEKEVDGSVRPPLICHSAGGMFAVRDGQWKLVAGNGSGGRQAPKGKPFGEPWSLFNLSRDPGELKDVATEHPDVFERLKKTLYEIKGDD
ncbi:MAG: arylsulfatase [Rubripirellula sp.]|nr:arylsulfatase [Rubripirellula sp.]